MKKLLYLLFLLGSIMISSCSKDSDTPSDNTTKNDNPDNPAEITISSDKMADGSGVKKDKSPRSNKIQGSTDVNGTTVTAPSNLASDGTVKGKLDLLTGTDGSNLRVSGIESLGGWTIKTINGDNSVEDQILVFFDWDGTYIIYDFDSEEWDWGYYYIDTQFSVLVCDPGTQYEIFWSINNLSSTILDITDGADDLLFTNYSLDLEEEEYTSADANALLADKEWYIAMFTDYDVEYDFYSTFQTVVTFKSNGSMSVTNTFYDYYEDIFVTETEDNEGAIWSINSNGDFQISYNDGSKEIYEIGYALENEIGLTYIDNENGLDGSFEFFLMSKDNYISTFGDLDKAKAREWEDEEVSPVYVEDSSYNEPIMPEYADATNKLFYNSQSNLYYGDEYPYYSFVNDSSNNTYFDYYEYVAYNQNDQLILEPNDYLSKVDTADAYISDLYGFYFSYDAASGTYYDENRLLTYSNANNTIN